MPFRLWARKKYWVIFDCQLIVNFVSFTIIFITIKNYEYKFNMNMSLSIVLEWEPQATPTKKSLSWVNEMLSLTFLNWTSHFIIIVFFNFQDGFSLVTWAMQFKWRLTLDKNVSQVCKFWNEQLLTKVCSISTWDF